MKSLFCCRCVAIGCVATGCGSTMLTATGRVNYAAHRCLALADLGARDVERISSLPAIGHSAPRRGPRRGTSSVLLAVVSCLSLSSLTSRPHIDGGPR
jgi:hypothetical protein